MEKERVVVKKECHSRLQPSQMIPNLMGFTLIELLVVVLIVAILAAVALPQYRLTVAKSTFVKAMVLGNSIYNAQKLYELNHGKWTSDFDKLDIELPNYDSTTKRAYLSNNKNEYCYRPYDSINEIYCYTSVARWHRYNNTSSCFFVSNDVKNNDLAEKVCKSVCKSEPKDWAGWSGAKVCSIRTN